MLGELKYLSNPFDFATATDDLLSFIDAPNEGIKFRRLTKLRNMVTNLVWYVERRELEGRVSMLENEVRALRLVISQTSDLPQ